MSAIISLSLVPDDTMIIKNWSLSPQSILTTKLDGKKGQGPEQNPYSVFYNHALVYYGGYYDPSYGSAKVETLKEWELASVEGYGHDLMGSYVNLLNNLSLAVVGQSFATGVPQTVGDDDEFGVNEIPQAYEN